MLSRLAVIKFTSLKILENVLKIWSACSCVLPASSDQQRQRLVGAAWNGWSLILFNDNVVNILWTLVVKWNLASLNFPEENAKRIDVDGFAIEEVFRDVKLRILNVRMILNSSCRSIKLDLPNFWSTPFIV